MDGADFCDHVMPEFSNEEERQAALVQLATDFSEARRATIYGLLIALGVAAFATALATAPYWESR